MTQLAGFYNGAVGLDYDVANSVNVLKSSEGTTTATAHTVTVVGYTPLDLNLKVGDQVVIAGGTALDLPAGYQGTFSVTAINVANPFFPPNYAFQYTAATTGLATVNESSDVTASFPRALNGHVDPRPIMDVGVVNGNIPAPLMAIDEDDEFFLTLTNVGMIMRPDLFEQHTVHFHGYPNASAFYDGVPDASVAINIGGSFTYYYLAPDAGTYFWHCHITPPEHLQMGMVGQLYVRPRQNRVPIGGSLYNALVAQQTDPRTACNSAAAVLHHRASGGRTSAATQFRRGRDGVSNSGIAGNSHARHRAQCQAAPRSSGNQPRLRFQLDHPSWWRVARRDSGCYQLHGTQYLLSLHPKS